MRSLEGSSKSTTRMAKVYESFQRSSSRYFFTVSHCAWGTADLDGDDLDVDGTCDGDGSGSLDGDSDDDSNDDSNDACDED
ncbi:hypothetical protein Tco_0704849 [Tanacetum coccineum]|uniref:Uncharacterized protein n=1 Tax=Tanacetum coccineum TaxID=301880 RepID=A0ABQ4Y4I6_9ASTR